MRSGRIDARDHEMLEYLMNNFQVQNRDLCDHFGYTSVHASRMLRYWRQSGLLMVGASHSRLYRLNLVDSPLLPAFVARLREEGFAVPKD